MSDIRFIVPGTPHLEKFLVGDRVAHITAGDGIVTAHEDGCVVVTYDALSGKKRKPTVGKYDANWFRINPSFLFHRSRS